jgi:hypothetical protein
MSTQKTGWYQDPEDAGRWRYWDDSENVWTDITAPGVLETAFSTATAFTIMYTFTIMTGSLWFGGKYALGSINNIAMRVHEATGPIGTGILAIGSFLLFFEIVLEVSRRLFERELFKQINNIKDEPSTRVPLAYQLRQNSKSYTQAKLNYRK